jgi:hypothetical protein
MASSHVFFRLIKAKMIKLGNPSMSWSRYGLFKAKFIIQKKVFVSINIKSILVLHKIHVEVSEDYRHHAGSKRRAVVVGKC